MKTKTFTLSCLLLLIFLSFTKLFAQNNSGTDFWVTFSKNYDNSAVTISLFITSGVNTTGTVSIPGQGFSANFTVTANMVTTVVLPPGNAIVNTADGIEDRGIHVISNDPVTLYGLNRIQFTTDAFLGLPTNILGTEYIVLSYRNSFVDDRASVLFSVVGTENGTNLTIVPSVTTGVRTAGVPYNISLNQGQVYQLRNLQSNAADLTGTIITSNKPVAVFGGHTCVNIPVGVGFCDLLTEQLPPTTTWGKSFITVPLKLRLNGDRFRFLAKEDNTTIIINGVDVATINRGQFHERILTASSKIETNKPILVAQYSHGRQFDNVTGDPFMMLVPPYEQFLGGYTVTTPASGFNLNFVNIVAPNAAVGLITLDGVAIPAASFSSIGTSGFSGAQVDISIGSHNFNGTLPFGTFIYGFNTDDSYGYPGGLSLSPVATVTAIALAPKTASKYAGEQHCVTATVTDQFGNPVTGVRVDFLVIGVNDTAGFANTSSAGTAQFCFLGNFVGKDSIVASVGVLKDDASIQWNPPPLITVSVTSLPPFSSVIGIPSAAQSYTVSGIYLINNIIISPPPEFEISLDQFSGFTTGTITLPQTGGVVNPTTIWVRMNSLIVGSPSGNVTHSSTGAVTKNVAVSGDNALPVELSSFTANAQLRNVNLSWQTKTETNSALFEIERQTVSSNEWLKVGQVQAAGNSNSPKDYSFTDKNLTSTKYQYRLKMIDADGRFDYSKVIGVEIASPKEYAISQNYPNPFNPKTTIEFQIPERSFVTLKICDMLGTEIATLVNEEKSSGRYEINFDASKLSSGTYLYILEAGDFREMKKMILLK